VEWVTELINQIFTDGAGAVKAILLLVSGGLGWMYFNGQKQAKEERKELIELFQRQIESDHKELIDIIERYQESNLKTVEAINEIKVLIATIGTKL
jgi:hypothetical protein